MPENEFDRQVKKMMDELKLRPSDEVWPGVEKRIRENKRRRRAILIFPLVAGLLLAGYLSFNYFNSKSSNNITGIHTKEKTIKEDANKISLPNKKTSEETSNQSGDRKTSLEEQSLKKQFHSKDFLRKIYAFKKYPVKNIILPIGTKANDKVHRIAKNEDKNPEMPVNQDTNEKSREPSVIANSQTENTSLMNIDTIQLTKHNDSTFKKNDSVLKSDTVVQERKALTVQLISLSHKHKKHITWGFHFATGISGSRNTVFKLNQDKAFEATGIQNSGTGSTTYGRRVPSSVKTGIAFKAGALIEKDFSKKSSFDAGIQYSYYSDHIKVGHRTDSVIRVSNNYSADQLVSGFYINNSLNNYINRYHFLELPVNYHFQMIQGKQNSLSWDFGLIMGKLISTNALVFDTSNGGVYYTDKKQISKFSVDISTGFSISFNEHKSMHWIIGPELQLGLINLYKNYADRKAYPFYAGIDLRLMLPKK